MDQGSLYDILHPRYLSDTELGNLAPFKGKPPTSVTGHPMQVWGVHRSVTKVQDDWKT